MTGKLISCLMPVYNGEAYLAAALDSILVQSHSHFELVCVDDGSTDASPSIMAAYAVRDPRIRIHRKDNGGIVSALNFGLTRCSGDYIARMDADDLAVADRFAIQVAEFRKRGDAVAVGGLIVGIDQHGNQTGSPISPSRVTQTDLSRFPPVVANVQHSAGMFLASAMRAVDGYRSSFPHAEDYDLYLRLAAFGKFYNPPQVVLHYRKHPQSVSVRNLVTQETNAALAELSALARLRGLPDPGDAPSMPSLEEYAAAAGAGVSAATLRRYIDFRIWRRLWNQRTGEVLTYRRRVIEGLRSPFSYGTAADRGLSMRIALSVLRKTRRSIRRSPKRGAEAAGTS